MLLSRSVWLMLFVALAGCGTTRWSDTARTATEQMLISDAIDRSVSSFDLRALAGKRVYLDTTFVQKATDSEYLVSSLRQHALASGCILRTKVEEADYVVEVRSGAIGTDHHDLLVGIPATTIPSNLVTGGPPAPVPELPIVKKTDQRAVAKIALFAYNRATGRPVWQSGLVPVESSAKAVWVCGAGPFRRGTVQNEMRFAGEKLSIPMVQPGERSDVANLGKVSVASEAYFSQPVDPEIVVGNDAPATPLPVPAVAPNAPIPPSGPSGAAWPPAGQAMRPEPPGGQMPR